MSFNREEFENAHTAARRQRARLRALADLIGSPVSHDRAARAARQIVEALEARASVFHRVGPGGGFETLALHHPDAASVEAVEAAASRAAAEVVAARQAVSIHRPATRHPRDARLTDAGVGHYLGVPLFDRAGAVVGVASALYGEGREPGEEDVWWMKAAAQFVSDELSLRAIESELRAARDAEHGRDTPPDAEAESGEGRLSILVVDDDRALNDVVCEFLDGEGHRVEAAFDGLEAVRKFRPAEHDVVLTDVAMPLMNGWELIAALRVRAPALRVILVTGYGSGNWNESYLRKQGVTAILGKPLDTAKLASILQDIIAGRRSVAPGLSLAPCAAV